MADFNDRKLEDLQDAVIYSDLVHALEDAGVNVPHTPYGATKTAELDVQFSIDPSYGLTKERFGWFSNGTIFDDTFFTHNNGKIEIETSATTQDIARLRSAFPGQYTAHTIAEPGVGARIPQEHLEYDSDGFVSLTHGEISIEIAQWSDTDDASITAHGISYEPDGVYHQVRAGNQNVEFTHQSDWNIDKMNGNGPSETQLRPERGYVYNFLYTWYGEGSYILAVHDARADKIFPVHRYPSNGQNKAVDAPNMPTHVTVENKDTADPLKVIVGGMQFTTYGAPRRSINRTTEESRYTASSFIADTVSTTNNAIDPYAQPGVPLISARRDVNDTRSEKGLRFNVENLFLNVDQDCWMFVFDEYNDTTALTGANFTRPVSRNSDRETQIQTDTEATDYTPSSDAVLRGMSYVEAGKKTTSDIAGDTTSEIPLQSTAVVTAALAQGSNATDAQPALLSTSERF